MEESSSSASYHSCSPGDFFYYKEKGVFMDRSKGKMEGHKAIGVAVDFSSHSKKVLQWAVDNLVHKEDYLILVNVQASMHYEEGKMRLWEPTSSPLIPLNELTDTNIEKKYGVKPDAETLDILTTVAAQKEVVVVMKVFGRDACDKICVAIENIPLNCLVIGSRGPSKIKRLGLQHPLRLLSFDNSQ